MTIFAVACAGTFPGIHVGRAWLAFWLALPPGLNLWMWPQFRSHSVGRFRCQYPRYGFLVVLVHGSGS